MPLYTNLNDIQVAYRDADVEFTSLSQPSDTDALQHLADAEGICHAYLSRRYGIPLTETASIDFVRPLVIHIAAFNLWHKVYPNSEMNPFKAQHDTAMRILRDISENRADIPTESSPSALQATACTPENPVFRKDVPF